MNYVADSVRIFSLVGQWGNSNTVGTHNQTFKIYIVSVCLFWVNCFSHPADAGDVASKMLSFVLSNTLAYLENFQHREACNGDTMSEPWGRRCGPLKELETSQLRFDFTNVVCLGADV